MPDTAYNKENTFTRLYNATQDSLYHYLRNYIRDTHLIHDLMQQCYMKVWERIDDIQDIEKSMTLIKKIARNLLTDVVRKRMKEDVSWLESVEEQIDRLVSVQPVTSQASMQALDIAIARLPHAYRTVYVLHREEGLSYRQISLRLYVSVSTVEKRMSKAIRLLKHDLLADYSLLLILLAVGDNLL